MRRVIAGLLRGYKRWLSPMLPPACRYVPTCSEYAEEAVMKHGVVKGLARAAWRVLRCHPLAKGGYDPVPSCQSPVARKVAIGDWQLAISQNHSSSGSGQNEGL